MTTAEARKEVEFQMREWGASELYSGQVASIDALVAAVRAEERAKIVKALREEGTRRKESGEPTDHTIGWLYAIDFVESLDRGDK